MDEDGEDINRLATLEGIPGPLRHVPDPAVRQPLRLVSEIAIRPTGLHITMEVKRGDLVLFGHHFDEADAPPRCIVQ